MNNFNEIEKSHIKIEDKYLYTNHYNLPLSQLEKREYLIFNYRTYFNNYLEAKFFNKNGDGVLFLATNNSNAELYAKKVSSLKLDDKIDMIYDKFSSFKYYDYALNENGNGLLFLTNGKTFKTTKIINFYVKK